MSEPKKSSGTVYDDDPEEYNKELSVLDTPMVKDSVKSVKKFYKDKKHIAYTIGAIVLLILLIVLSRSCSKDNNIEDTNALNENADVGDNQDQTNQANLEDASENNVDTSTEPNETETNDQTDELENESDIETPETAEPVDIPKGEFQIKFRNMTLDPTGTITSLELDKYTQRPTCRGDFNVIELYTKFNQLPSTIKYDISSLDDPNFSLVKEYKGSFEDYRYIYICDKCDNGEDLTLPKDKVYLLKISLEVFGKNLNLDSLYFSTYSDSDVLTHLCSVDTKGCTDSENVRNPNARGRITVGGEDYVEFCFNQTATEEYYCVDGELKKDIVDCGVKCWLGRCID